MRPRKLAGDPISGRESLVGHPLDKGVPPPWASEWGQDRYGVFVGFRLDGVDTRMRWIPPGRFVMGSPKEEQGRLDREGPQHVVTLTRGFWLADTPCTQALWMAVMDDNPSRFQSPDRPVEQVSWHDCQSFLKKLGKRVPALEPRLPTEAEWEYACRADTTESSYAGEVEILGANNAPLLDEIAWYGGNSGVGFELENGDDSSGWPQKQHPHTRAGTHPVAQKRVNPWGLYDMLGNVWEWCAGDMRDYAIAAEVDPAGGPTDGQHRVVRGGSWNCDARFVRAAYRFWYEPDFRIDFRGFRLARGQDVRMRSGNREAEPTPKK